MARSHAKIQVSIWDPDGDFVALNHGPQWLYELLLSQKKLTLVGLLTYTPSRWARLAADTTLATVEGYIDELEASRFVVVDRDTDELLIRTLVKNDVANTRMLDNVNLLRGMWNAWTAIESRLLRHIAVENIPASVWDSPKATPPAEAQRLRGQPPPNPRSRQLERHVPTTHPDQPSERDVPTSLRPSPFALPGFTSAAAHELNVDSADPTPAAAVDNQKPTPTVLDPGQRQQRLAAAVELLVDREVERHPTRGPSVDRHRKGVRMGKLRDHHQAGHQALIDDPYLTPDQLADLLEPAPASTTTVDPDAHLTAAARRPFVPNTPDELPADTFQTAAAAARAALRQPHPEATP